MQDVLYIEAVDQAAALLKPLRLAVLKRLDEPRSCPELADALGEPTQKLYYHVKVLERVGLVDKIGERRVGGIMEGVYQAAARSYWLSPGLVGQIGGPRRARDGLSREFLLSLAEELQGDVALLARQEEEHPVPTLGLSAQIELRNSHERAAFMTELQETLQALATKYGARGDAPSTDQPTTFRLMVACYPATTVGKATDAGTTMDVRSDA
jgi:DNA-binding transcriptional ArsR family regulator